MCKMLPEAGVQVTGRLPSTRSLAVAANVTTAPVGPVASAVMLAGRVSTGGDVSTTVTLKLPEAVLPAVSVAEQLTVVAPRANVLPEDGAHVTVGLRGSVSVALAVKVTTAPAALVASAVMSDGSERTGGVMSPPGVGQVTSPIVSLSVKLTPFACCTVTPVQTFGLLGPGTVTVPSCAYGNPWFWFPPTGAGIKFGPV